jgi:glutathionylspermidine synthase
MERIPQIQRRDWENAVEHQGYDYHTDFAGGNKKFKVKNWNENFAYCFKKKEIELINFASKELHEKCLEALDRIVEKGWLDRFPIPTNGLEMIEASWRKGEKGVYGRFDFSFNGNDMPKLLEYNADTPVCLLEAALIQEKWQKDCQPEASQFNKIQDLLIHRWQSIDLPKNACIYFTGMDENKEIKANTKFLLKTALASGFNVKWLPVEKIGWAGDHFVDEEFQPIKNIFKLYPWEWIWIEEFGDYIKDSSTRWIEPPWKLCLSNKMMLVILWELFPNHPNLLPASCRASEIKNNYVRKPIFGREGANVTVRFRSNNSRSFQKGPYGSEGFVYQEYAPLFKSSGYHATVGSWMIGDEPAGLGIREDRSRITGNWSAFVPHYVV